MIGVLSKERPLELDPQVEEGVKPAVILPPTSTWAKSLFHCFLCTSRKMTLLVCSMTALASEAKKYSTSLSSRGWNSEVESERGIIAGIS